MEWIDVKFSDFLKERKGRYKPNDEAIKGLKRIEKIDFSGQIYLSDKPSKTDMILVKDGDLVISGINVEKGAMNIFHGDEDVVATIHYSSYTYDTNVIKLEFLKHFLKSKKFKDVLKEQVPGGIKTEIKPKHLLPLQIQIPKSLDDQKKIVEHLDQLYDKLNDSSTEITHQLDLIKNLRQAFLREAMQGLLVSNETSDNKTGADLLAEIQAEKAQLVKEKKIKKPKPLAPITEDEIPFNIPENWTWCRLGEICTKITDGTHHSPKNYPEGDYMYVTAKNIKHNGVDLSNITYVSEEVHNEIYSRCDPEFGDILYIKDGATTGISAINNLYDKFSLLSSVALLKFNKNIINNLFLNYALNSPFYLDATRNNMFGVAITRVTLQKLNESLMLVPPLEIQERIVAKLDELMSYCDALEEQVKQSGQTNELLLQQVLREALGA